MSLQRPESPQNQPTSSFKEDLRIVGEFVGKMGRSAASLFTEPEQPFALMSWRDAAREYNEAVYGVAAITSVIGGPLLLGGTAAAAREMYTSGVDVENFVTHVTLGIGELVGTGAAITALLQLDLAYVNEYHPDVREAEITLVQDEDETHRENFRLQLMTEDELAHDPYRLTDLDAEHEDWLQRREWWSNTVTPNLFIAGGLVGMIPVITRLNANTDAGMVEGVLDLAKDMATIWLPTVGAALAPVYFQNEIDKDPLKKTDWYELIET